MRLIPDQNRSLWFGAVIGAAMLMVPQLALADDASDLTMSVLIDAGANIAPAQPVGSSIWGQQLTDRASQLMLDQAVVTLEKPLVTTGDEYTFGFRAQTLYGTDARYSHVMGQFDLGNPHRNQFMIVDMNVSTHMPIWFDGGVDLKVGQYVTPIGVETSIANGSSTNYFYTHSYMFNFGEPVMQTGAVATLHVLSNLDFYVGLDQGVDAWFGPDGDNNSALAAYGGINLTLLDGDLNILGLTHSGPETGRNNHDFQYNNDLSITYKLSAENTVITELGLIRDDYASANGFGIDEYFVHTVSDGLTLISRAEFWRDDRGYFVYECPTNQDFALFQRWQKNTVIMMFPHGVDYAGLTLGANIKLAEYLGFGGQTIARPEIRYDRTLNDMHVYSDFKDVQQVTFGLDFLVPFTVF